MRKFDIGECRPGGAIARVSGSPGSPTVHLDAAKICRHHSHAWRGRCHGTPPFSETGPWICRGRCRAGRERTGRATAAASARRGRTAAAVKRGCPSRRHHRRRGGTSEARRGALVSSPLAQAPSLASSLLAQAPSLASSLLAPPPPLAPSLLAPPLLLIGGRRAGIPALAASRPDGLMVRQEPGDVPPCVG